MDSTRIVGRFASSLGFLAVDNDYTGDKQFADEKEFQMVDLEQLSNRPGWPFQAVESERRRLDDAQRSLTASVAKSDLLKFARDLNSLMASTIQLQSILTALEKLYVSACSEGLDTKPTKPASRSTPVTPLSFTRSCS